MMSEALFTLLLLACPVGMGLMMWVMMRGSGQQKPVLPTEQSNEITRLRAEVDQLQAEQRERQRSTDRSS